MDEISEICECDDPAFHPPDEGECGGPAITFRNVRGMKFALCRNCTNGGHMLTVQGQ